MSSTVYLLTNLQKAVWGNQTIFKETVDFPDPVTGHSHAAECLDFGDHLTAIKVIAPTVRFARFFVRKEYRDAVEAFEKNAVYSGGACVMGQPGIGKSCFIAYAVIERLRQEKPVAVQLLPENCDESYALFSEKGVSLHSGYAEEPLRSHQGIWAFSDSSPHVNIPAVAFLKTDVSVFQTTSPKVSRWKEWTKQKMIKCYIMDIWSPQEISALAVLLHRDVNRMNDLASKWGHVPRTLLQLYDDDQEFEHSMRYIALGAIPECRKILRSTASLDTLPVDSGPSSIFFLKPKRTRDAVSRTLHTIYIPTQKIAEILAEAVNSAAEGDRQDFFNAMISYPDTRNAAGFIFETWITSFIISGNPLQCTWHEKSRKQLTSTLVLEKPGHWVCTDGELQHTQPPFYWRAPPGFKGIDGALFDEEDNIYAIQMTISFKHSSPQSGLDELRGKLTKEMAKKKHWRVLFIGNKPEQSEAVSSRYIGKLHVESGDGGLFSKGPTSTRVGWCATGPASTGITVVKTLTNYAPPEVEFESDANDVVQGEMTV